MPRDNHYLWLERNFKEFVKRVGGNPEGVEGLIRAHGDKCSGYRAYWTNEWILFEHGIAIYLLGELAPWRDTVRETATGWVDPCTWVIWQYPRYEHILKEMK